MTDAQIALDFMARLRAYVRKRVASQADADDIVQSVVLRLLEREAKDEAEPPAAWVLATARSAIVDFYRTHARSAQSMDTEPAEMVPAQEESDIVRCLAPLMRALPADDRALLERVDMRSESQVSLAEQERISISTLKSRVQRARLRLRELILRRCEVERDLHGSPTGAASCRKNAPACGCDDDAPASGAACP